jgi:hypothetical protein
VENNDGSKLYGKKYSPEGYVCVMISEYVEGTERETISIDGKLFSQIVSTGNVEWETTEKTLEADTGHSRMTIPLLENAGYEVQGYEPFVMDVIMEDLIEKFKTYRQFIAKDDLRPVMNAIAIKDNLLCATDANTLIFEDMEGEDVLFPAEMVNALLMFEDMATEFIKNNRIIGFTGPNIVYYHSNLLDNYPRVKSVIPDHEKSTSVDIASLKKFVEEALMINIKHLHIKEGKMTAYDADSGNSIEGVFPGDPLDITIGFDFKKLDLVLSTFLKDLKEDYKVTMKYNEPNNAVVFQSDKVSYTILLMPVMVS